jgi:hypothetical protein
MQTPAQILQEIKKIRTMERGTLCRMREGKTGPLYNHQTWENGRNVVRYVPREHVAELQQSIAEYQRFIKLTQCYADLIISQTRSKQTTQPSRRQK